MVYLDLIVDLVLGPGLGLPLVVHPLPGAGVVDGLSLAALLTALTLHKKITLPLCWI